jgi:hypothetical protein
VFVQATIDLLLPLIIVGVIVALYAWSFRRRVRRIHQGKGNAALSDDAVASNDQDANAFVDGLRLQMSRHAETAAIIVLVIAHGHIAKSSMSLFPCSVVSAEGPSRLTADMSEECYRGTHLAIVCAVVVPSLLFGVIGIPLFTFSRLRRHRHDL